MYKMNRYARGIIAAAAVLTAAIALPAGAITLDWNDLTDAQQENAYKKLESENEDLRKRVEELEGQLGISGQTSGGSTPARETASGSTSADGSASDSSSGQAGPGDGSGTAVDASTDDDASSAAAEAQASAVRSIDGFLADLMVQSRINDAREKLEDACQQVEDVLRQLPKV